MSVIEPRPTAPSIYSAVELAPVQPVEPRSIGFVDGFMLLRRHQLLIGLTIALCTILSLLVVSFLPRIYVAGSVVVLERKDSRPFETDLELKSQDRDRSGTETEMDIMRSRYVAGLVVDELNLISDPVFNTYLRAATSDSKPRKELVQRDRAVSTLLQRVTVSRRGESLAIAINVEDTRPEMAAQIADSIAENYVKVSMDFKRKFASKAMPFLEQRGSNPLLAAMRGEELKLQQTRSELAAKLGVNHPDIQAVDAKIARVRGAISGEFERMAEDLHNETERPSARVLSMAQVPTEPTYPDKNMIVSGTFVGSALLSVILALVLEGLSTAIRNGEQTLQLLNVPNLAYVPVVSKSWRSSKFNPVQEIAARPRGGFAVSMRSLYLGCRLPRSDQSHKVIMLSSCPSKQGLSAVSVGLAAAAAADGKKTVLVDLDRDDSILAKSLKLEAAGRPLNDFLSGNCGLKDVVSKSPDMGQLSVISASQQPVDQTVILNSDRLRLLVNALRKDYSFVVINTAPVLNVEDANWLAPLVDAVILVLIWGKSKEGELLDAAAALRRYQAPLIGTVIEDVDPRQKSRYGLGTAKY